MAEFFELWERFCFLVHHHHDAEEEIFLRWMRTRCEIPGDEDGNVKDEHTQLLADLQAITDMHKAFGIPAAKKDRKQLMKNKVAKVGSGILQEDKEVAFANLRNAFADLHLCMVDHLAGEERIIPPLLRQHFTEVEHDKTVDKIIKSLGLKGNKKMLPWVTEAMSEWGAFMRPNFMSSLPAPIRIMHNKFWASGHTTKYSALLGELSPRQTELAFKGSPCIHLTWSVPKRKEREVDAFWKRHEAWMRNTHKMGSKGDDSEGPRLNEFFIAKGAELKDPLDPKGGFSGQIVYSMSEAYVSPDGISKHIELAKEGFADGFEQLMKYQDTYGVHMDVGTTKVFTALQERVHKVNAAKHGLCKHMTWVVPKSKEKEVDSLMREHEMWMRATHAMGADAAVQGAQGPVLTAFWVAKGPEFRNPLDPSSGQTGNIVYSMNIAYADKSSLDAHLALAKESFACGLEKITKYQQDYGLRAHANTTEILTNLGMEKSFTDQLIVQGISKPILQRSSTSQCTSQSTSSSKRDDGAASAADFEYQGNY